MDTAPNAVANSSTAGTAGVVPDASASTSANGFELAHGPSASSVSIDSAALNSTGWIDPPPSSAAPLLTASTGSASPRGVKRGRYIERDVTAETDDRLSHSLLMSSFASVLIPTSR